MEYYRETKTDKTTTTYNNVDNELRNNVEQKKPDIKEHTEYDAIYIKFTDGHNEFMIFEVRTVVTLGASERVPGGDVKGVLLMFCLLPVW